METSILFYKKGGLNKKMLTLFLTYLDEKFVLY